MASEAKPVGPMIFKAMQEVMKDITHVAKAKRNQQQGFVFRGIDDVMNALHGPLQRAGVFITSQILDEKRSERTTKGGGTLFYTILRVEYRFNALDGSCVSTVVIGEAMDSGDKSTSKALSIAFKYAMMQVFSIPTEEQDDPDAETHDLSGEETGDPIAKAKTPPTPDQKKKDVKNHAPQAAKISPMQQVGAAISRFSRDKEVVGRWIRAMYPSVQFPTMSQALADIIIRKIEDTPDEGLEMEIRDQRPRM